MQMRFSFVGDLDFNDMSAKVPFFREIKGDNPGVSLNLVSIESKSNRAFCEMAGFKNDVLKFKDENKNEIEIPWSERFDENAIKKVPQYMKRVITVGDARHEFISDWDMITFIRDHVDELKGKKYQLVGQVKPNEYKGKIQNRFSVQNLFEVRDEEKKKEFKVTGEFFFNKDSIDTADFAKEAKIYINGWTLEYLDKDHPSVYLSKQLVFDCSKLDFDNENHVAILNYKLKQIGCAYENGKITIPKLKKNKYYKIAVICKYINGQEQIEFSEKDLNDNQRMAISLGISKLEDFKPNAIYGDRVQIFKLVNFDLRGDYADGCVEESDFDEEQIYTPSEEETVDQAFSEDSMNAPEEATDDTESLFD